MKKITELITLEQSYKAQTESLKAEHQESMLHLQKAAEDEILDIQSKLEDKEAIIETEVAQHAQKQSKSKPVKYTIDTKQAKKAILDRLNQ